MWEWAVRALGAFWLVGGVLTLLTHHRMRVFDGMLAGLSGGVRRRDVVRTALLTFGAVLTALAGLLLAALDRLAPAALLANAGVQAAWLFYAAREFPPEDDEDRLGRARVTNAFGVWLVGTGLVLAAEQFGVVRFDAAPMIEGAAGVVAVAVLVWQGREIDRMRRTPALDTAAMPDPTPEEDEPYRQPRSVILGPEVGCWPLWDADDGRNLDPWRLDLPAALRERIGDFEGRVIDALDVDHPEGPSIVGRDVAERLEAEAIEITRALAGVYGEDAVAWRLPNVA